MGWGNFARTGARARDRIEHASRATSNWVAAHWLGFVGGVALLVLVLLTLWQSVFVVVNGERPEHCAVEAFTSAAPASCEDALRRVTESASRKANPATLGDSPWAWEEPGKPRLWVWLDNLFVDLYTLFFVGICARGYFAMRERMAMKPARLTLLLTVTVVLCLAAAIADHTENFWLLAHINSEIDYRPDLAGVAAVSAWKFRLFAVSALLSLSWWWHGNRAG